MRAAIYCRISKDDQGDALGVKRQERECRALAKAKGWTVAAVLTDNDVSAYNGAARARYDEMLERLRAGDLEAVVAFKLDRLTRSGIRGLAPLLEVLDGRPLACVHDQIDTSTAMGEGIAGILASAGKAESEALGVRMRSKKAELAADGKPAGGPRAFGYEADGRTVREPEAEALRQAGAAVLAGESLTSIARRWIAEGVRPPQSRRGTWTATQVRAVLTNPRQAGLRAHRGEVLGQADWPAVLDMTTHERLRARLLDPSRRRRTPPRRGLYTGLIRCGACGAALSRSRNNGRPCYRCPKAPGVDGCGRLTILAEPVEAIVTAAVLERLDGPGLAQAQAGHDDDDDAETVAEVERLARKLEEYVEMFAADEMTRAAYVKATRAADAALKAARRKLGKRHASDALDGIGNLRADWEGLSDDRRREVLAAVLERVTIAPASRPSGAGFDADRIAVTWTA